MENKDFIESLNSFCTKFDKHLEKWSKIPTFPQKLKNSISYINKTGGKRIRPFIVCEIASLFGAGFDKSIAAAVAIEMIHTYSLIHDDLPSMDNDDFRRGKMTLHKKYDEAIAILTGDSLLTESFSLLVKNYGKKNPKMSVDLILYLSCAAGGAGLVGGQILDLYPTGKNLNSIKRMQKMKTGELFICSSAFGAILGAASKKDFKNMIFIGDRLGRSFQIIDDILDVIGDEKIVGKKTRKDREQGKVTLVDLLGIKKSRLMAKKYIEESIEVLSHYRNKSDRLIALSKYIIDRSL